MYTVVVSDVNEAILNPAGGRNFQRYYGPGQRLKRIFIFTEFGTPFIRNY